MSSEPLVYLNGEYLPYDQAVLPIEERSTNFGDAVYEVVRYYHGRPFRLERHMARLQRSAAGISLPLPPIETVTKAMAGLIERQGLVEASLYLQISRGSGPRVHTIPTSPTLNFFAIARPVDAMGPRKPLTAITVSDDRWARCYLKTTMLLPNTLARQLANQRGAEDAIFIRDGFVTEATASNLFVVKDGRLLTPPLSNYILAGITRETVIELAEQEGIPQDQVPIAESLLGHIDEAFLSGTISEVSAITAIDGRPVGTGRPGPIFERIASAFDRLISIG